MERVAGKKLEDMSSEEVQFHYFKLHDYDQNNKLDGLEIMSAMTHYTRGKNNFFSHVKIQSK